MADVRFGDGYEPVTVRELHNGPVFWGRLIQNNIYTPASPAKRHILDALGSIIERWLAYQAVTAEEVEPNSNLLRDVMGGGAGSQARLESALANIGWELGGAKRVVAMRNLFGDYGVYPAVSAKLNSTSGCFSGIVGETLFVLFNQALLSADFHSAVLVPILRQSRCIAAEGYEIDDIGLVGSQCELARSSLDYALSAEEGRGAAAGAGAVVSCSTYVMRHFLDMLRDDGLFRNHPAAVALKSYDERRGTEMARTLYQFLLCERDYAKAAKLLNVHRNTVQYRVERACELAPADLEDDTVRMHVLLSLHLMLADGS